MAIVLLSYPSIEGGANEATGFTEQVNALIERNLRKKTLKSREDALIISSQNTNNTFLKLKANYTNLQTPEEILRNKKASSKSPAGGSRKTKAKTSAPTVQTNTPKTHTDFKSGKIYIHAHGTEVAIERPDGTTIKPADLAEYIFEEGGLKNAIAQYIGKSPYEKNNDDYHMTIRLLSCLTGRETKKEERGNFTYKESETYAEDFARIAYAKIEKIINEIKAEIPAAAFEKAALSINFRVKAPRGSNVILPNGQSISYYAESSKAKGVNKLFTRSFKGIKNRETIPGSLQSVILKNDEKTKTVEFRIQKFRNQKTMRIAPVNNALEKTNTK